MRCTTGIFTLEYFSVTHLFSVIYKNLTINHILPKTRFLGYIFVGLSVKHVDCDKTKETCAHIISLYYYYITWKIIHPSFLTKEWLVGATTFTWNFGPNWPCWSESADFQSIFSHSASAVKPSEKSSIITNRTVHHALSNEPKMNIVRCT